VLKRIITPQEIPFEGTKEFRPGETIVLLPREPSESESGSSSTDSEWIRDTQWMRDQCLLPSDDDYEDPVDKEIIALSRYGVDDCVNASDGYRTLPKVVLIQPTKSLRQVWDQVESKLGVTREHYALVNQSHYLPQEGSWHEEIQSVETRCRGRAGGQKNYPLVPPRDPSVYCEVIGTEFAGHVTGVDGDELACLLFSWNEIENPISYPEVGEDRIGVGLDQKLNGGRILVYCQEDLSPEERCNQVRGVWIEHEDSTGEETVIVDQGTGSEIKAQIQDMSCYEVKRLWRGLFPLGDDETAIGETLDVEFEETAGEVTIKLDSEYGPSITTFVRPLEVLFDLLKAEFGWDNRVELFLGGGKERITYEQDLRGSTLILKGIMGRERMVRAIFPGERCQTEIPRENGREILEYIQEQVETPVRLKIIESGLSPCEEEFSEEEDYQDVGLELIPLRTLPEYKPVENRDVRFKTYRMRREQELWLEWVNLKQEYVGNFLTECFSKDQGF
jgi:hypothetical protein